MTDEFIIGTRAAVDRFAEGQGWRLWERAAWRKADGCRVHYLLLPEQVAGLPEGATLHVVGVSEIGDGRSTSGKAPLPSPSRAGVAPQPAGA